MWQVTRDRWHVTGDTWQVTRDTWQVTHGLVWTFSQNFSSLALRVWELWCSEYLEEKHQSVSQSSFSSQSSKHHNSQTLRARDLKFWHNDHHPLCVLCHMSCVTCHMLHVTCHMLRVACHVSNVTFFLFLFFSDKLVELVGGVSGINRAYLV